MYEAVVIGCGPVGALTANLLGVRGVRTLVVERSAEPHGQPRAFSCDDEALRIFQQAGLREEVERDTYPPRRAEYVNARGRVFAEIALDEIDFGLGAKPLHFFDQPRLEAALRRGLARFPHVTLRTNTEVTGLTGHDDHVTVTLREDGRATEVDTRYVLGADGARSTTRVAAGIALRGASDTERWLAVSGDVQPGGTRVDATRFVCDWRRPAFVSPGAFGTHRLEFMLLDGEDPEAMTSPAAIRRLVAPYVDPDRFAVTRAVVYAFHHLVADRWRDGRVFLLGDAAHQMPPFLGQGLCSGLRDAANLTWRLAQVLRGDAEDALLDGYEAERRPHAEEMALTSVRLGRVFLVRNRVAAAARDVALRAVQAVPRVRRAIRHFEFKPRPALPGHRGTVGTMFPQPDVAVEGRRVPLDDVLGAEFAVVGPGVDAVTALTWRGPVARFARVVPAGSGAAGDITTVEDVDGTLCAWFAAHGADVVVLRPDRFVHAVGTGPAVSWTGSAEASGEAARR
ncbi:bifunctional 3-(3-hydroxy-phenyl)propionate/3-hydroxycinnamic acid hydroxylase [Actinosynnema sp. NPDC050436]|uniref:bifunctional 3-(3-hydroxy-phenyl)propionate/3-hydroxycinnamic acid hydroxylase n=1 Tax=Actinosynnema sp. NPDC050436 TaxID=3155659 RepID=UPI0033C3FF7E